MVIEWLKIKVRPDAREDFIQKDAEVWTAALVGFPGFLGKEIWINPADPSEVVIVIRWASREQWKAFPQERLRSLEAAFKQGVPTGHEIVAAGEYQVRKFAERK
jgi:uncharacterized protein (TIGR03792 family)